MKTGIDLGTTYSLVSVVEKGGVPTLVPDSQFSDITSTPSIVHINERNAVVGHLAEMLMEQDPELHVIRFFKRHLGESDAIYIDVNGSSWYPETVAALVIKKLMTDVESYSGRASSGSVITVPAHFNDVQRKAVLNAAALADLPVLGLLEEPIAAALHYGVQSGSRDQVLLVYDLGGGTFDSTVLSMNDKGLYVLAKDGLTEMGGKEFDEVIGAMVLEQFGKALGHTVPMNGLMSLQLRRASEEIKIELGLAGRSFVKKTVLLGRHAIEVLIHRKDFERSIQRFIDETISVALRCVQGAGLKVNDVNSVMLVGGSTFIPSIKQELSKALGTASQQLFLHEPMKAVAFGAALHTAQLTGEAKAFDIPPELRGVTGYHVGIRTLNPSTGRMEIDTLIKKNMPLPAKASRTFYTNSPTQTMVRISLVQFLEGKENTVDIGEVVIGPLANPSMNHPVEVVVENTADGTIRLMARDTDSGIELKQAFGGARSENAVSLAQQKILVNRSRVNIS